MDKVALGSYIQDRRKTLGLSQRVLADLVSYSSQSISLLEKGSGNLPVSLLPMFANALKLRLEDLLSLNPNPSSFVTNSPFEEDVFLTNLVSIRANHKLSQNDEAEKLGLSLRTLRNYEKGVSKPNIDFLLDFAKLHDVEPTSLFVEAKPEVVEPFPEVVVTPNGKSHKWQPWLIGALAVCMAIGGGIGIGFAIPNIRNWIANQRAHGEEDGLYSYFVRGEEPTREPRFIDKNGDPMSEEEFYAEPLPNAWMELQDAETLEPNRIYEFLLMSDEITYFKRHFEIDVEYELLVNDGVYRGPLEPIWDPCYPSWEGFRLALRSFDAADDRLEDYIGSQYSLLVHFYNNHDPNKGLTIQKNDLVYWAYHYQAFESRFPGAKSIRLPFSNDVYDNHRDALAPGTYTLKTVFESGEEKDLTFDDEPAEFVVYEDGEVDEMKEKLPITQIDNTTVTFTVDESFSGRSFTLYARYMKMHGNLPSYLHSLPTTFTVA